MFQKISLIVLLTALVCNSNTFAQSQRDIASRKTKSCYTVTIDSRKDNTTKKINLSKYDRKGNIIESIDFDADSNITNHEIISYNHKGDETLHQWLNDKGTKNKEVKTEYDKWNNPSLKLSYDGNQALTEKIVYHYNASNQKVLEEYFNGENKLIKKNIYEYDNKDMLISRKTVNDKNETIYQRTSKFEY